MILTGKQIVDLAQLAGLDVQREMLGEDELNTEFSIQRDDDGEMYAHYTELPEEGAILLG